MKTNTHLLSYPAQFFLEWEKLQTKVVEKTKTHLMFSNLLKENPAFDEILWKNTVDSEGAQMTIWHMRISRWVPKTKNTRTEHVIVISFLQQQRLHERTSLLRYTYSACLVVS